MKMYFVDVVLTVIKMNGEELTPKTITVQYSTDRDVSRKHIHDYVTDRLAKELKINIENVKETIFEVTDVKVIWTDFVFNDKGEKP